MKSKTEEIPSLWYDYINQCWVENGIIQPCAHPESMHCNCYGKLHQGEEADLTHYEP